MINFKNRAEATPSAILICAVLTLLGALFYMLLVPPPNSKGLVAGKERSAQQLTHQIDQLRTRTAKAKADAANGLWKGDHDTVMALILARLTKQAAHSGLQIGAFRPQKQQAISGMIELPVIVQVSGAYPTVLSFVQSLGTANSQLAVRSLQIASADAASNVVSATIGLSAYYVDTSAPPPTAGSGSSSAAPRTAAQGTSPTTSTAASTAAAATAGAAGGRLG